MTNIIQSISAMAPKFLSKKQQDNLKKAHYKNLTSGFTGLIIARFGSQAQILTDTNEIINCKIRKTLPGLVVGDMITWLPDEHHLQHGIVIAIAPRRNELKRLTIMHRQEKLIAANIDQLLITIAPVPDINWSLVDHYIMAAFIQNIEPIIILNKTDLPCHDILEVLEKFYASLSIKIILLNRNQPELDQTLLRELANQTSIFVGQSGVGKSTILQRLLPTAKINIGTAVGQHTTSISTLFLLPNDIHLIDSPGIRELDLGKITKPQLDLGFPDIKALAAQCRFRNCDHQTNPGCAFQESHNQDKICQHRLKHYISLLNAC